MRKYSVGFTLIELIIVISVVGIMTGLLISVIKPDQILAKGRDARRMQDLDVLSKALVLALADGQITLTSTSSCTTCTSITGSQAVDGSAGFVKFSIPSGKTGLSVFIPTLPLDPKNLSPNIYTYGSNGTDFELNTLLESTENASRMSTDGGTSTTIYEVGTALNIL